MITLEPPYPVVDGYALLPDHADPGLFYALPTEPSLAMADGRPALSLIQYLGGGAGAAKISGGILQLTTELVIPPEVLATLPAGVARQRNLTGREPRVVPVTFDTGTVELTVLGRTNTPPPDGSAAPGGTFEVQFSAGGKPSMGNTNQSSFQLILNENAAELIGACLDKPELPVLVTYVMTFAALRPSFTIDIHADWHKVYKTLQQKFTANAWVAAADVDIAITDALETSGVDVDTVVMGTGDGSAAAAQKTKQQLLDWVLERLFQPMSPPEPPGSGIGRAVGDAVWSLTRAILPGVSYKLKKVDENQLRHLDVRARERVAEVRELRPQGMLGGLLRRLRVDEHGAPDPAWPAIRAGMLSQVELSGFPRLEVGVDLVDRFGTDGLRSCRVQLARALPDGTHADGEELAFTAANAGHRDWVVNLLDDAARSAVWDTPYEYRVLADFDPASPLRPVGPAESPWKPHQARDLLVDPREAYAVTDVTVNTAPLFSFELFAAITVELRPYGAGGAPDPARTARLVLKPDAPSQQWRYASAGAEGSAGAPYSWRATYHRPLEAGGDVTTEWADAAEPWLSLPDPMPEKLAVNFFVDLPWPEITAALLELRYDDEEHDVHYAEETITLTAATPVLSRTYSIASGGSRALGYRLTIKLAAGGLVEGSWREATDDRIIVDRRLVDERQVRVRAIGGPLSAQNLVEVAVALQVRDPATQAVRASTRVRVLPGQEAGFAAAFSYLVGDPPIKQVFHQVTAVDSSGFVRTQPWEASGADLLVLDLRTQTIKG